VKIKNLVAQPQGYYAAIVCVRANARFAYPRTTFVVTPNGGMFNNFSVRCPRKAPHSINTYFGTQSAADSGSVLLSDNQGAPLPDATVDDVSNQPVAMFGGAVCTNLRRALPRTSVESVGSGMADGWIMTCPPQAPFAVSGWFLVYGALSDLGSIEVTQSALITNFHKWLLDFNNVSGHAIRYVAGAVCVGAVP
jgi:hypothetical protein